MKQLNFYYLKRLVMTLLVVLGFGTATLAQEWKEIYSNSLSDGSYTNMTGTTINNYTSTASDFNDPKSPNYVTGSNFGQDKYVAVKYNITEPGSYYFSYRVYLYNYTVPFKLFWSKVSDVDSNKNIVLEQGCQTYKNIDLITESFNISEAGEYYFGFYVEGRGDIIFCDFRLYKQNIATGPCTISWSKPANGSITVKNVDEVLTSPATVLSGTTLTVETTADENYELVSLMAGTEDITESKSFVVKGNTKITAEFGPKTFTLTKNVNPAAGGSISVKADGYEVSQVKYGQTITVEAVANAGYKQTGDIVVDGVTPISGNRYQVTGDVTVTANFEKEVYTVTKTVDPDLTGSLSVTLNGLETETATYGDILTVTATPYNGYELSALDVQGATFQSGNQYSVTGNVNVTVTFRPIISGGDEDWEEICKNSLISPYSFINETGKNISGYQFNFSEIEPDGAAQNFLPYNTNIGENKYIAFEYDITSIGKYKFSYKLQESYKDQIFNFFWCKKDDVTNKNIVGVYPFSKGETKITESESFEILEEGTYYFGWYVDVAFGDISFADFRLYKLKPATSQLKLIKNVVPADGGTISVKRNDIEVTEDDVLVEGDKITLEISTNPGYKFADKLVDGATLINGNEYSVDGTSNVIVTAKFVEETNPDNKINNGWKVEMPGEEFNRIEVSDVTTTRCASLSLGTWVKIEDGAQGSVLMGHRPVAGYGSKAEPTFSAFVENVSENAATVKLASRYSTDGTTSAVTVKSAESVEIPLNTWNHIAVTVAIVDGKPQLRLYVNGNQAIDFTVNEQTGWAGLPYVDSDEAAFVFGEAMAATYTDIMVWNKTLSESEVRTSMKGYRNIPSGLQGYYLLDIAQEGASESLGASAEPAKYATHTQDADYSGREFKADLTGVAVDITAERPEPRGGARFFADAEGATEFTGWTQVEHETMQYASTSDLYRLVYNGVNVQAVDGYAYVYHNGDPGLPTYVAADDYLAVGAEGVAVDATMLKAGVEYTAQMPAANVWMPVSLPANVDLVVDNDNDGEAVNLRPMWNFWYSNFNTGYTYDGSAFSDVWASFKKDTEDISSKSYKLVQPGIISVPKARAGHSFTFYTMENEPVVVRALNSEYNATLMPDEGKLAFVANPYSFAVSTSDLVTSGMDVYRFNAGSGNFDLLSDDATLNPYEPVMVFNNDGGALPSPRYIGTKAVSGILEYEAVYDVNVRGAEGAVEVSAFQPADVEIYTVNGVMVAAGSVEGTHSFALEAGIYVVRTVVDGNAETVKVVVE